MYPGHGDELYERRLEEITTLGATHVALTVSWSQRSVRSNGIAPRDDVTVDDEQLRAAVRRARELGLEVIVFPLLDVRQRSEGYWRGTIDPDDVDTWWKSYEGFILHYASIAGQEHAAAFVVGSELASTEAWRDRWHHLIAAVEDRFDGTVIYSANWDHYDQVSFWRRVDAIGVSAYFALSGSAEASEAELTEAWRKHRAELEELAASTGKPLWITEVGYPSLDGAATAPWDYTRDAEVDLEEQRRCYEAFVRAWDGADTLAGTIFWNWWGDGGSTDRSYTPRGKPAAAVLQDWYGGQ